MGHLGLDPETALELIQTLLYWIACMCAGWAVVGLSAYILFLCLEIFSPQPRSRAQLAKVPHPVLSNNSNCLRSCRLQSLLQRSWLLSWPHAMHLRPV